jgi:hypothetical protein
VRTVLTATSVPVDTAARFTAEVTRGDHLSEQRAGPVFRIAELVVNGLHDRQQHIEPNQVGQRQRAHRVIATERHALVDFLRAGSPSASTKKASLIIGSRIRLTAKRGPLLTVIGDSGRERSSFEAASA